MRVCRVGAGGDTVALCFLVLFRGIIYSCLSMEVRGALVVWDVTNYLANITVKKLKDTILKGHCIEFGVV